MALKLKENDKNVQKLYLHYLLLLNISSFENFSVSGSCEEGKEKKEKFSVRAEDHTLRGPNTKSFCSKREEYIK